MIRYLTVADLYAVAEAATGQPAKVRDHGLVEAALYRPQASAFGVDAYPDLRTKAAALLQSLATNHALIDGNKRTAMVATELILRLAGATLPLTNDQGRDLALDVATSAVTSVEAIAKRLQG